MDWKQIIGLLLAWVFPEATMILWDRTGVPLWQTVAYIFAISSIAMAIFYFGIGWLKEFLIKRGLLKKEFAENVQRWWENINNFQNGFQKNRKENFLHWVKRRKSGIILSLGFVPVPVLPTLVLAAARLTEIKNAFFVLILGLLFRTILTYWLLQWLTGLFS